MVYIVRYGEIGIKGKNRPFFEKKLIQNIKLMLEKNNINFSEIKRLRGRILVYSEDDLGMLRNVFGIVSFSRAVEIEREINKIEKTCLGLYEKGTFRVSSSRLDKKFSLNSREMNEKIGEYILKNKNGKVKLKNPDKEIFVELFNDKAYVFDNKARGLGGLPIGVSGKVCVVLEEKNSLTGALAMMKRGCLVCFLKRKEINVDEIKKFYPYDLEVLDEVPDDVEVVVKPKKFGGDKKEKFKDKVVFNVVDFQERYRGQEQ